MVASAPTWRPTWMVLVRYSRDTFDSFFSRSTRNDPRSLHGEVPANSHEKGHMQDNRPSRRADKKMRWIKTSNISPFNLSRAKPAVSQDEQQHPPISENSNTALLTRPNLPHLIPSKDIQADRNHDKELREDNSRQQNIVVADASALGAANIQHDATGKTPGKEDSRKRNKATILQDSSKSQDVGSGDAKQTAQSSSHNQTIADESVDLNYGNPTPGCWDGGMARAFGLEGNLSSRDQVSPVLGGIRVDREVEITSEKEKSRDLG